MYKKCSEGLGLTPERLELRGHSPSLRNTLRVTTMLISLSIHSHIQAAPQQQTLSGWAFRVLTVAGQCGGRQAAAVLSGIGKTSWICADARDLSERAVELSRDRVKLRELRLQQRGPKLHQVPCSIID